MVYILVVVWMRWFAIINISKTLSQLYHYCKLLLRSLRSLHKGNTVSFPSLLHLIRCADFLYTHLLWGDVVVKAVKSWGNLSKGQRSSQHGTAQSLLLQVKCFWYLYWKKGVFFMELIFLQCKLYNLSTQKKEW